MHSPLTMPPNLLQMSRSMTDLRGASTPGHGALNGNAAAGGHKWFHLFRGKKDLPSCDEEVEPPAPSSRSVDGERMQRRHTADHAARLAKSDHVRRPRPLHGPQLQGTPQPHVLDMDPDDPNEEEVPRRPSIPSSIVPLELPPFPDRRSGDSHDDDDDDSIAGASVVSEVTLMTYSDEKAELVKEEFFRRLRKKLREAQRKAGAQGTSTAAPNGTEGGGKGMAAAMLSLEEREALLREVQAEQEAKFKKVHDLQKRRRKLRDRHTDDTGSKNDEAGEFPEEDFFDRLNALRLKTQSDEQRKEEEVLAQNNEIFCRLNSMRLQKEAERGGRNNVTVGPNAESMLDGSDYEGSLDTGGNEPVEHGRDGTTPAPTAAPARRESRRAAYAGSRRSSLAESFCSVTTAKRRNHHKDAVAAAEATHGSRQNQDWTADADAPAHPPPRRGEGAAVRASSVPLTSLIRSRSAPGLNLIRTFSPPSRTTLERMARVDERPPGGSQESYHDIKVPLGPEGKGAATTESGGLAENRSRGSSDSLLTKSEASSSGVRASIDDIIELKLQIANQQATIDTLSGQLHNLEVAHRQSKHAEAGRMQALEAANAALTEELGRCREGEAAARRERESSNAATASEEKQRMLERNRELERENDDLRRRLEEARALDANSRRSSLDSRRSSLSSNGSHRRGGGGSPRGSAATTQATESTSAGGESVADDVP